jgi:hypothetical protein
MSTPSSGLKKKSSKKQADLCYGALYPRSLNFFINTAVRGFVFCLAYGNPTKSAQDPFLKVTAVDKTLWETGVKEITASVSLGSIIRQKEYGVPYLNKKFW